MGKIYRIYMEKKEEFAIEAKKMKEELSTYLGVNKLEEVRILIRYDIENIDEATFIKSKNEIFSEPPINILYEENFPQKEDDFVFIVEYLPGQFDQRADSAIQCLKLISNKKTPIVRVATAFVLRGDLTGEELEKIKNYCVNPVDSRIIKGDKFDTLESHYEEADDVEVLDGFIKLEDEKLKDLYKSLNLAMTVEDFIHIQDYFKEEERDPSMTEIRVLDTYWSDHCRHTTFSTELTEIEIQDGYYKKPIQEALEGYLNDREKLYKDRDDKYISLMDIATLAMKRLKAEGKLEDIEESEEINACSIVVPVEIDGNTEEWLVLFKNETHNHPTEIEPFGGAGTCLGGAIRDPLSGRSYVYQAMRITGAADPRTPFDDTLPGKLPQRKIVNIAADGYSSYGNQIGAATGLVSEIYHPNYVAKRMELGAVIAAAPRKNVIRKSSSPGDQIILIGGRTGRDGIGGATGSSKVQTAKSIEECGAEVQKGNPPIERNIQRLFRKEEVSRLIKKCNDFGAGGVSVAIGELADGLCINLDKVPTKYEGLNGTEIAISESQERMAIVVSPENVDKILKYSEEENLEATVVAEVTKEARLIIKWRNKEIANLSRAFLDTNGAHQKAAAYVTMPKKEESFFKGEEIKEEDIKEKWLSLLSDLNVASQKGLVEMFDSTVGAGSVTLPFGGQYQMTPIQTMISKLPILKGDSQAITMMSYGYDPYLSTWSPFHGSVYAVLFSVAKIVASGGDFRKIRFTFQEYFKRLMNEKERWGQPLSALLGAYDAQIKLGLPSIGGKDSMSGTFHDIDVPPTLVSFAVNVGKVENVITPEFKEVGNLLIQFNYQKDKYDLPNFDDILKLYDRIYQLSEKQVLSSSYAVGGYGLVEAISKMAFGNQLGVLLKDDLTPNRLFDPQYGTIIAEIEKDKVSLLDNMDISYEIIGELIQEKEFRYKEVKISIDEALYAWTSTLESTFPTISKDNNLQKLKESKNIDIFKEKTKNIYIHSKNNGKPKVLIPVFPGTNGEYDATKAFEKAGAKVETLVFKTLTKNHIKDSMGQLVKSMKESQILMIPGGITLGDEPGACAKFITLILQDSRMKEEVNDLLTNRDGLILGIGNGFQALIKTGLVPYGEIKPLEEDSPTLTQNIIGRHISKVVSTKVVSNKSPWLQKAELGGVYSLPISHGEGRFVASDQWIQKLSENGQIAARYVDLDGNPTMDEVYNPNGSYYAVESITSPDGRVLGKMGHSERIGQGLGLNIKGKQDQKIFEAGVDYFL